MAPDLQNRLASNTNTQWNIHGQFAAAPWFHRLWRYKLHLFWNIQRQLVKTMRPSKQTDDAVSTPRKSETLFEQFHGEGTSSLFISVQGRHGERIWSATPCEHFILQNHGAFYLVSDLHKTLEQAKLDSVYQASWQSTWNCWSYTCQTLIWCSLVRPYTLDVGLSNVYHGVPTC